MISRCSALEVLGSLGAVGALRGLGIRATDARIVGADTSERSEPIRSIRIGVIPPIECLQQVSDEKYAVATIAPR
jgi:hypothetical protein